MFKLWREAPCIVPGWWIDFILDNLYHLPSRASIMLKWKEYTSQWNTHGHKVCKWIHHWQLHPVFRYIQQQLTFLPLPSSFLHARLFSIAHFLQTLKPLEATECHKTHYYTKIFEKVSVKVKVKRLASSWHWRIFLQCTKNELTAMAKW